MSINLRELKLSVIGVHRLDLLSGGCAQHFDDLNKLVDSRLSGEQGLTEH